MIDLRQLRHFVMVCEELHFRRAAERLGMTQPPLTQSIQTMERELGVALFKRSRRNVALTKAGELLLPEARGVLAQSDRLLLVARRSARGEVGTLRVGFTISASFAHPFTKAVHAFQRNHPEVALELHRTGGTKWIGLLERGEVDLCVTRPLHPINLPCGFDHVVVQRDELMLLLHAGHRLARRRTLALPSVVDEPFIAHPWQHGTAVYTQVMGLWASCGLVPRMGQELGDATTIMGLVAAGVGISILPSSLRVVRLEDIAWRPINTASPLAQSAVVLVYPAERRQEMPQAAFIDLVEAHARDAETT